MEEKKERNNKNVVVYTIIAIATLLIVVVGATFAYLESNVASNGSVNMNVTTSGGSELLLISAESEIELTVNEDNLGREDSDVEGTANANILLQTSGTDTVSETLNAYVDIITNEFGYTSGGCYEADGENLDTDHTDYDSCTGNGHLWTYSTTDTNGTCYTTLNENNRSAGYEFRNMCIENSSNVWAEERVPELLFDLYELDADESACSSAGYTYVTEDGSCRITSESIDLTTATTRQQVATGITLSTNSKIEKSYEARLVFANLDHNQYANSGKSFVGKLTFERVDD